MTHFDIHRGGLTPETPCASDLELARFVDGTLPPDARTRVVSHLAECDDCRDVVATVVAAQDVDTTGRQAAPAVSISPPTATVWLRAAAVAVVAAAIGVAVRVALPGGPAPVSADGTAAWTELARAIGPVRAIEAQLSGLPAYLPLQPPTRAAGSDTAFTARALAARWTDLAALSTDASHRRAARHVAAVATLVAGRADEAVALLDAALAGAPPGAPETADLLADLAAAHAELAEMTTRTHWDAALDAADKALAVDASHAAARFNRSLALERLGRQADALQGWNDLAADPTLAAGWRDEAASHARALVP